MFNVFISCKSCSISMEMFKYKVFLAGLQTVNIKSHFVAILEDSVTQFYNWEIGVTNKHALVFYLVFKIIIIKVKHTSISAINVLQR